MSNDRVKAWVTGVVFDENAKRQVENIANLPFIFKHIAVMPDVHLGRGSTLFTSLGNGSKRRFK